MSEPQAKCLRCDRTDEDAQLNRCGICFKHFCEDHAFQMSGRIFCSNRCAEYYFFADHEEEEE